jgi:hypothetical protein
MPLLPDKTKENIKTQDLFASSNQFYFFLSLDLRNKMKQNVIVLTGFFHAETFLEEWYTHLQETEAQFTA